MVKSGLTLIKNTNKEKLKLQTYFLSVSITIYEHTVNNIIIIVIIIINIYLAFLHYMALHPKT